jgi:hypothetical protein
MKICQHKQTKTMLLLLLFTIISIIAHYYNYNYNISFYACFLCIPSMFCLFLCVDKIGEVHGIH